MAKTISFGAKQQWDAMTGQALTDNPAIGRGARLNKDRSRMLTIVGVVGAPSNIYIYDTATWALQKVYVDGLAVETATWTAEDKIIVGVHPTNGMVGQTIDGYAIGNRADVGLRLLDPTGREPPKALWFPAAHEDLPNYFPWKRATSLDLVATSFAKNIIALGIDRLLDGKTLEIRSYYTFDEVKSGSRAAGGGYAFSGDGRYLYIKDQKWFDNRRPVANAVIETSTGKHVAQFGGGDIGIALSDDGKQLAIGNIRSVELMNIQ